MGQRGVLEAVAELVLFGRVAELDDPVDVAAQPDALEDRVRRAEAGLHDHVGDRLAVAQVEVGRGAADPEPRGHVERLGAEDRVAERHGVEREVPLELGVLEVADVLDLAVQRGEPDVALDREPAQESHAEPHAEDPGRVDLDRVLGLAFALRERDRPVVVEEHADVRAHAELDLRGGRRGGEEEQEDEEGARHAPMVRHRPADGKRPA